MLNAAVAAQAPRSPHSIALFRVFGVVCGNGFWKFMYVLPLGGERVAPRERRPARRDKWVSTALAPPERVKAEGKCRAHFYFLLQLRVVCGVLCGVWRLSRGEKDVRAANSRPGRKLNRRI